MRLGSAIALVIALLVAGGACWDLDRVIIDNSLVCTPGQSRACWCSTGGPGQQACLDDGRQYGTCACTPDAGVSEDAGTSDDAGKMTSR